MEQLRPPEPYDRVGGAQTRLGKTQSLRGNQNNPRDQKVLQAVAGRLNNFATPFQCTGDANSDRFEGKGVEGRGAYKILLGVGLVWCKNGPDCRLRRNSQQTTVSGLPVGSEKEAKKEYQGRRICHFAVEV